MLRALDQDMFPLKHVALLALVVGCASTPHTTPDEMSAADHQAEAAREAEQARAAALDEPSVGRDDGPSDGTQQAEESAEHWRAAAAHGGAAKTLISAESTACEGLSALDRETNPFAPSDRVASVTPLVWRSKEAPAGAAIALRAQPGLTDDKLRQQVRCHLARAATQGYPTRETSENPLWLQGIKAEVASSTDGEFVVRIVSDNPTTAREILKRAENLAVR